MTLPVFYVPLIHRRLAPDFVPEQVIFFPVGLPETDQRASVLPGSGRAQAAQKAVLESLPFSSREAQAILEEMVVMGQTLTPEGLSRQQAMYWFLEQDKDSGSLDEFADLKRFSSTGRWSEPATGIPGAAPLASGWKNRHGVGNNIEDALRRALADSQKILLLANFLEERLLEVRQLEDRFRMAEDALAACLGGEGTRQTAVSDVSPEGYAGKTPGNILPEAEGTPWRMVVEAALAFLPEEAVLFTADARMARELREAGMLQPFPEDRADVCADWPRDLVNGLLYANLPAYRLVGRRSGLAERPWLGREVEMFVARPTGGWLSR